MKRILATALLVAGLFIAPAAALAGGNFGPSPHVPVPNSVYARQWSPKFAPGHPQFVHRHFAPRVFAPGTVIVAPPVIVAPQVAAQPVWVDAGWQWNGWQWVWVPGYWSW
jgi:hypothetical protein